MGNNISAKSRAIDKQLKLEKKKAEKEIKILLLGAGDSGKSTIIKQMRLIHASGFTKYERESFRLMIFTNILGSMQALLEGMHHHKFTFENEANWKYIALFERRPTSLSMHEPYPIEYLEPLKSLWRDKGIQATFEKSNTFAFNEDIHYFFDQLDRMFRPDFMPTDADIIHCRIKTTGIVETKFRNGSVTYRMLDVGGQRSERKKWIHCFDNVAAILFVVALSGYDCCLVEDKYSMYEAFMLFESICNSKWFINTSIILFLNKNDLFKKKLLKSRITNYFPDYRGSPTDYNQAKEYFKNRFLTLNTNHEKQIYVHFTVATDTQLLAVVMESVSDSILQENLQTLLL
ncbi:guanine nucleotide binding protein, alpha subunit [Rhizopus microsporus var. microsporus]|uniref:Guanine nucleotide binding protein, alpha subunit n=2 Tax=Rhizopus microsporus TaxID=58291 RepID=A0A2G4T8U3_RHIZD|nr:guanine nucleotide binding protein, alpha subunit [Rhizopus microsporus ATCC 52813]ORE11927.1 guanine nucleotide binding protein, alpha subunit [Rhizopus microsporus var. microsporus]PHZ17422.1 guanine nucleotide binding protein, alpha subunit [Rhizopus microsporus ATCC 52813]